MKRKKNVFRPHKVAFTLTDDEYEQLGKAATQLEMTLSDFCRWALQEAYLNPVVMES